jgi:succinoglycan biosynthesis protein ExoL
VIKRARAFRRAGLEVMSFTFRRRKFNQEYVPEWQDVSLGETVDRHYALRLMRLLQALPRLVRERRRLAGADFFYARNIDMCALALLARAIARSRAPVVYEVLDVQRIFTGRGPVSFLFRLAERLILARIALLVVSSRAFISHYFAPAQGYAWPWFLLENKILELDQATRDARPSPEHPRGPACPPQGPWVIAWLGNLRCPRSPQLLTAIARALGDRVRIQIHGFPTETGLDRFLEMIAGHDNIVYAGEYRSPEDLPRIYEQAHFAWAFDYLDAGTNSAWLLPNRLYEGCYFGTPALAPKGTETGRRVEEQGLGWTVGEPVDLAVVELLQTLDAKAYLARRRHLLGLPSALFLDEGDSAELCRQVLDGTHAVEAEAADMAATARRAGL